MPHDERAFFNAFDAALTGDTSSLSPWLAAGSPPGLPVYRNTIASGGIDALVATFTTVVMMTGEDWFRAAAREYVHAHPPREPALLTYGDTFPAWLATFAPAADAPYLPAIVHLDWLWWQSWSAADAELLDGAALSELAPEMLSELTLSLHPSVRIATFNVGIPSLWLAHQTPTRGGDHILGDEPEHMLFVRTGTQVESRTIAVAPFAFIAALSEGASLLEAGEAALAADPTCALNQIVVTGLALGLFTRLAPINRNARHDN
jgi:hypothetical protein